jgi:RNA polymerase sigma-70 factor (ECF subfamily)
MLAELRPDEPEVFGLLSLMLLHDARRITRVDDNGDIVLIADQDRTRWDQDEIADGTRMIEAALRRGAPGPYQLQAAIAALHDEAASAQDTDWPQIALLYRELSTRYPSPVVELNRAVAVAMAEGPAAGLDLIDQLNRDDAVTSGHLYHSARADLLAKLGRTDEAVAEYNAALAAAETTYERRFLQRRLQEMENNN